MRMEVRPYFKPQNAVSHTGAKSGSVLGGAAPNNRGLRLRIFEDQFRGSGGPIGGSFRILDVGDGKHAERLAGLLGQATDAGEVLRLIRQQQPQCVNVVNANILVVEAEETPAAPAALPHHSEDTA
jgi:hypothetical protein